MAKETRDEMTRAPRSGLARLFRHRLVIPLLRSRHMPEHTARGVSVGLLVAFTPTIGIQMPMVFVIWLAVRKLYRQWDFNLLVALAWTWVSNIFTLPFIYYTFLVTGRVMLGRWDRIRDFGHFEDKLRASLDVQLNWAETLWIHMLNLFEKFGLPMFVGSVPWALLCAWIGYRWSLRLLTRIRLRRMRRLAPPG